MNNNSNAILKTHFLTRYRGYGQSKYLRGRVAVITVFLDDAESTWTEKAISDYRQEEVVSLKRLEKFAKTQKMPLSFLIATIRATTPHPFSRHNVNAVLASVFCRSGAAGMTLSAFVAAYKEQYGVDEVGVVLALNRVGRGFAHVACRTSPSANECAVIYRSHIGKKFYNHDHSHELLHLFGACDLYYPKRIKNLAARRLKASMMNNGYEIDPLTAYLIGWSEPNEIALKFMPDTTEITLEEVMQCMDNQWEQS